MRILAMTALLSATGFAQNVTEFGAVAIGSAVGGASGKPVSNGLTAICGARAAGRETPAEREPEKAAYKVGGPQSDPGGVPLPSSHSVRRAPAQSLPVAQFTVPEEAMLRFSLTDVAPALPPPPVMSPEEFLSLANGMSRGDVLKRGTPAAKITMFEGGHLLEVYSYRQNGKKFGTLRLTDGTVSSVE